MLGAADGEGEALVGGVAPDVWIDVPQPAMDSTPARAAITPSMTTDVPVLRRGQARAITLQKVTPGP